MGIITESRSKVKPGEKFGRWTVIGVPFSSNYVTRVVVECECGNVAAVNQHSLLSGQSLSCGCHRNDFKITHGQAKKSGVTPLYKCWRAILDRTKRSGHQFWEDYGGRGISVCDEWQQSFENFRNWSVENGYHPSLQLDRENNDRGYEPGNCRWVTRVVQARNKRSNRIVEAFGERKLLCEWAEDSRCIVKLVTLQARLNRGWNAERAITEAVARKIQEEL